jgi:predicted enzyme related to lactoylglutathione lyase
MNEHGKIIWNELVTADQKKAGDFYSSLLGWARKEVDAGLLGTYTIFQKDGKDVAGMMDPTKTDYEQESKPPRWNAYVAVEDIETVVGRVTELGGKILEPVNDIPGTGKICMIADPTGAMILLMQPAPKTDSI